MPPARQQDEYDVSALRAEMEAMRAERIQERAETALLRAEVQRFQETAKETEAQKAALVKFLEWVALTAEQKTQLVADREFADPALGAWWEVQLQEHPKVRVRAHSDFEAVGRYNQVCGITGTAHKHVATPLAQAG